jgi:hypothetical protein
MTIPLTPQSPLAVRKTKSPLHAPLPDVMKTDPPDAADDEPADNKT